MSGWKNVAESSAHSPDPYLNVAHSLITFPAFLQSGVVMWLCSAKSGQERCVPLSIMGHRNPPQATLYAPLLFQSNCGSQVWMMAWWNECGSLYLLCWRTHPPSKNTQLIFTFMRIKRDCVKLLRFRESSIQQLILPCNHLNKYQGNNKMPREVR